MKRSYLKVGDKSTANGIVVEGIPHMTHEGTNLTFVGAHVSCPSCHSTGQIIAKGPRWPDNLMGKQAALEGDVCACKCSPQPTMLASQSDMTMSFDGHALASMGFASDGTALADVIDSEHWIRFATSESGNCDGLRCAAHFADGSVEHGTFDANNMVHFDRPNATPCNKVEIIADDPPQRSGSIIGSILTSMVG